MKEIVTFLANFFADPRNFLAVALLGVWHLLVVALYLAVVNFTVAKLRAVTGQVHWLFWSALLVDEILLGLILVSHFFSTLGHSPLGRLWRKTKRGVKGIIDGLRRP